MNNKLLNLYNIINNFIKNNILLVVVVLLFLLFSNKNSSVFEKDLIYNKSNSRVSLMYKSNISGKKIVQNFSLNLTVKEINKYQKNINLLNEKYNAYVESFNSNIDSEKNIFHFSIKVPTKNIKKYIEDLKNNDYTYVSSENYYSSDYTEIYNDNENKLKNLYTRRDKLRNMMKIEAKNLADVIAIDRELYNVQNEIENIEKSNLKIDKDVEYSALNLNVESKNFYFKSIIVNAFNSIIISLITILHYFVVFVVLLPIILILFLFYIIFKKIFKKCIKL